MHKWNVSPKEAIKIQLSLAKYISLQSKKLSKVNRVAGVDVSFNSRRCCAAICVFTYPKLKLLEKKTAIRKIVFPYIPSLLAFREGPVILDCFKKIENKPGVLLFDGQGIAHPRKLGLATHIGLWLKIPTIGCAKTLLCGEFTMPAQQKGSYSLIRYKGESVGVVVRTKDNTQPLFVSVGHKITLPEASKITLNSCTRYRVPEPLRAAHTLSKITLKRFS